MDTITNPHILEENEENDDVSIHKIISKIITIALASIFFVIAPITSSLIFEVFSKNVVNYYIVSLFLHCSFLLFISVVMIEIFRHIDLNPVHPLRKYRIYPLSLYEAQKHYQELAPSFPQFYKKLVASTSIVFTFSFWILYFSNRLAPAYIPITFYSLILNGFLLACTFVTTDFWYYVLHRVYHLPILYKHLHKTHHEYHNVTVLTSFHASLIEYIFFDIPIYNFGWLSLLYFGFPIHTSLVTLTYGTLLLDQLYTHSGYDFSWSVDKTVSHLSESRFHFYHHKNSNGSYGALFGIFDRIFGSYKLYHEKHQ
jgi:sterol desaturase/sphingolipid hydroxylase (fatty acid hydroxylase superfamily)